MFRPRSAGSVSPVMVLAPGLTMTISPPVLTTKRAPGKASMMVGLAMVKVSWKSRKRKMA